MKNKLQQYFPLLRTREEVLKDINGNEKLSRAFLNWSEKQREEFLDFCTGVRGIKMLYEPFCKEILDPETYPERLNELLSLILGKKVQIIQMLPNDGTRLGGDTSLLVMDIVVRLEDGSIANVEIQKIGYKFPGQRCACYSADLLLRQYRFVRSQSTKETFSYKDIKDVYTIVILEKSTQEFKNFPDAYLHYFQHSSNTGLGMDLLSKYVFLPLDIFLKRSQNKTIRNRLEAWLTFLGSDDPEDIAAIVKAYPDFGAMYEQIYEICRNTERVMEMFSEELRILDRNTVRYMMDEMQSEIDQQKEQISQQKGQIDQQKKQISQQKEQIDQQKEQIEQQKEELERLRKQLQELKMQMKNS